MTGMIRKAKHPRADEPVRLEPMPFAQDLERHERMARYRVFVYGSLGIASFIALILLLFYV